MCEWQRAKKSTLCGPTTARTHAAANPPSPHALPPARSPPSNAPAPGWRPGFGTLSAAARSGARPPPGAATPGPTWRRRGCNLLVSAGRLLWAKHNPAPSSDAVQLLLIQVLACLSPAHGCGARPSGGLARALARRQRKVGARCARCPPFEAQHTRCRRREAGAESASACPAGRVYRRAPSNVFDRQSDGGRGAANRRFRGCRQQRRAPASNAAELNNAVQL